jgi:hypothetical protein
VASGLNQNPPYLWRKLQELNGTGPIGLQGYGTKLPVKNVVVYERLDETAHMIFHHRFLLLGAFFQRIANN